MERQLAKAKLAMKSLMMDKEGEEDEKPLRENLSFFSNTLRGKVLKMVSTELTTTTLPTIIIGTISPVYDEDMWDKDMLAVGDHFNLNVTDDVNNVFAIKMISTADNPKVLDTAKAIKLMEMAVFKINAGDRIRIVRIGISSTEFFFEAVSYLLNQWSAKEKKVQFVTSGDTDRNKMYSFCKSLCISGYCQELEYYNTQDYHPFGFFKSEWHRPY